MHQLIRLNNFLEVMLMVAGVDQPAVQNFMGLTPTPRPPGGHGESLPGQVGRALPLHLARPARKRPPNPDTIFGRMPGFEPEFLRPQPGLLQPQIAITSWFLKI